MLKYITEIQGDGILLKYRVFLQYANDPGIFNDPLPLHSDLPVCTGSNIL